MDNLIEFEIKSVVEPLKGILIDPESKTVMYWFFATVTLACKMEFGLFPMDDQHCKFRVQLTYILKPDLYSCLNPSYQ